MAAENQGREGGISLERLVFFSDAVFAIAITLLVIDIKVPELADEAVAGELSTRLGELAPNLYSFLLSFMVIAAYWLAHHRMFRRIVWVDGRLLWINMAFLLCIAFQPFPTALLGRYGNTSIAVVVYAGTQIATGLLLTAVWAYATFRHRLVAPDLEERIIRASMLRGIAAPLVFALSLPLAFRSAALAEYSWLLLLVVNPLISRFFPARAA